MGMDLQSSNFLKSNCLDYHAVQKVKDVSNSLYKVLGAMSNQSLDRPSKNTLIYIDIINLNIIFNY